jgi:adenosylmethionine-8-amino-7-oxononanoate aminotransferase
MKPEPIPAHEALVGLDRRRVWHPFTPAQVWEDPAFDPVVIVRGEGAELFDDQGRGYLDGNSSIWTNLHGHNRRELNEAVAGQLGRIAHSSFLGLTNGLAPVLAERLCSLAGLDRCFFSDDGSTAVEAALKIVYQYFQQNGQPQRTQFLSLRSAYHGDTVGAMSLGHSPVFHRAYEGLLFRTHELDAPSAYHSPHQSGKPERGKEARAWGSCLDGHLRELEAKVAELGDALAGLVIEPRVQGAAGFLMHPAGYLESACRIVQQAGGKVILDEVMTGFGRTGPLFAFQKEKVKPDLVALAKGLTGGYLPLAATLLRDDLYDGFRGGRERAFFHGHSYTANQLGCAAALASLEVLESAHDAERRKTLAEALSGAGKVFWNHPNVGDVRQEGLVLAVELVADPETKQPLDPSARTGWRVCEAARAFGLLTRPVGDVLVLMPPYCASPEQIKAMAEALEQGVKKVLEA